MSPIVISGNYSTGELTITSEFQKRNSSVQFTSEEKNVFEIIEQLLTNAGRSLDCVTLQRKSDKYLTLVLGLYDFCRFKSTAKTKWFTIALSPEDRKTLPLSDERLSQIANTNQLHWKIKINSNEDILLYSDLILKSFDWADYQSKNF